MFSAAFITNVSQDKQCGHNQTAPDLGLHLSASTLFDRLDFWLFKHFSKKQKQ